MAYPLKANILTFSMLIRLVTTELDTVNVYTILQNIINTSYIVLEKVDGVLVLTYNFQAEINP